LRLGFSPFASRCAASARPRPPCASPREDPRAASRFPCRRSEHEQVVGDLGLAQPVAVERVEVLRGAHRQILDLPFRHASACPLLDQLHDLVERRLRTFLGDDAAQVMRVLLVGQPVRGVEWRDSLDRRRLIEQPPDLDLPDRRFDPTRRHACVSPFDPVRANDLHAALSLGTLIEVPLHEVPQHRGPILGQQLRDVVCGRAFAHHLHQAFDDLVHRAPSLAERAVIGDPRGACRCHQATDATRSPSIRTAPPKPTSRNRSGFCRRGRSAPLRFLPPRKIRTQRQWCAAPGLPRELLCSFRHWSGRTQHRSGLPRTRGPI
jgi:hypothetical protein